MQGRRLILADLEAIFQAISQTVRRRGGRLAGETTTNPKGDRVREFDLAADRAVCAYLSHRFPHPVLLLSEEGEPRRFGDGEPEFVMVLDPVDGSDNLARGIPLAGTAVALIPSGGPIAVGTVQYALVGDLFTGDRWVAERGQGAFRNGIRIRPSRVTKLEEATVSCELNHFAVEARLAGMLSRAQAVRTLGCATRALSMVADGSLDAHLDVRGRLTPENFLAPSLVVGEAGGLLTDPEGKAIPAIQSLTERYSIVAAATPELHADLISELK
jgi:myo-inositol-1(or 4)-monophosphatase